MASFFFIQYFYRPVEELKAEQFLEEDVLMIEQLVAAVSLEVHDKFDAVDDFGENHNYLKLFNLIFYKAYQQIQHHFLIL